MKLILLGYMGSGKSTIGKLVSKKLSLPFIDLDIYIELQENLTISEIFKIKGEIYFRKIERVYLNELLQKKDSFILSLGGGTPCYSDNMSLISSFEEKKKSIYLDVNLQNLVKRLRLAKDTRPLIASMNDESLTEYIAKHLFERKHFYLEADIILKVQDKSIQEITNEIITYYSK